MFSVVQSAKASVDSNVTNGSMTLAFPGSLTAGNMLWVAVTAYKGGSGWPTVFSDTAKPTDTLGHTYVGVDAEVVFNSGVANAMHLRTFYVANCLAGANTVTVHLDHTCDFVTIIIAECNGIVTTSPLDVSSSASSNANGTAPSSGMATTTQASEVILGAVTDTFSTGTATFTPQSGAITLLGETNTAHQTLGTSYNSQTSTGTYDANWLTDNSHWGAQMGAFKLTGGGGGGSSLFGINISQEFQSGVSAWGGVFPVDQFQGDLDYLWSLGIRYVRIAAQGWNGSTSIIQNQNQAALQAKAKGFHVSYGLVPGGKPSDWAPALAAQTTHAQLMQTNGSTDIYYIGNENEAFFNLRSEALVSITGVSNFFTIVTAAPHSLATGDPIVFHGDSGGNPVLGIHSNTFISNITVVDPVTFTFTRSGTDGTSTDAYYSYASSTVFGVITRQATALKALGITMKLAYSCSQGVSSAQIPPHYFISDFVSYGRGDLDYVDLNMYGTAGFPGDGSFDGRLVDFKNEINAGYSGFGSSHFRVTEWNQWFDNSSIPHPTPLATYYLMERLKFLRTKPNLITYFFCYRQRENLLTVREPYNGNDGAYWRDWWWPLIGKRQPFVEELFGSPVPVSNVRQYQATLNWNGLSFNYGSQVQGGMAFYNASAVANDFTYLWATGVRKLRIALSGYTFADGVNATKQVALDAKAKGFYVVWGITDGGGFAGSTDATWAAYTTAVNAAADWAMANGIDEFQIGNEIEYSQTLGTLTNAVSKILTMATDVKTNHFTGTVSYAVAQDSLEATWIAGGKGSLDLLGYNVYGSFGLFSDFEFKINAMYAAFGSTMYISEWSCNNAWVNFPQPESAQTADIANRFAFLQSLNLVNYFFTYRWDSNGDDFALLKADGTFRGWWGVFFSPIPRSVATGRTNAGARKSI